MESGAGWRAVSWASFPGWEAFCGRCSAPGSADRRRPTRQHQKKNTTTTSDHPCQSITSSAFYEHIRNKDYGLSPEIPADKRTINQFRRFTGRAEGLSISFESHLLGSKIEYDERADTLTIRNVPSQLRDQLKRSA
nr:nucleoid-associated protein [Stutzerimonas stutzeri]